MKTLAKVQLDKPPQKIRVAMLAVFLCQIHQKNHVLIPMQSRLNLRAGLMMLHLHPRALKKASILTRSRLNFRENLEILPRLPPRGLKEILIRQESRLSLRADLTKLVLNLRGLKEILVVKIQILKVQLPRTPAHPAHCLKLRDSVAGIAICLPSRFPSRVSCWC